MKSRAKVSESARSSGKVPKSSIAPLPARKPSATQALPKSRKPLPKAETPIPARENAAKRARVAKDTLPEDAAGKRRPGMRGAAPWAARHAAKHAEEAALRNLEPPKPGSARGTLRTPDDADGIKQRVTELHSVLVRIRVLRKNLHDGFFQLANELRHIQEQKLYEAKGFHSFEAFAERELDLGKATTLKLARVPDVFHESAARHYGLEAVLAALDTLDERASAAPQRKVAASRPNLPLKPPI